MGTAKDSGVEAERERSIIDRIKGTPSCQQLGVQTIELGVGTAEIELEVAPAFKDFDGTISGMAVVGLAGVCAYAALATMLEEGESARCVEQKTNFLGTARSGGLLGRGRVVQRGKRVAVTEMEIRDGGGVLTAKGIGTYLVRQGNA